MSSLLTTWEKKGKNPQSFLGEGEEEGEGKIDLSKTNPGIVSKGLKGLLGRTSKARRDQSTRSRVIGGGKPPGSIEGRGDAAPHYNRRGKRIKEHDLFERKGGIHGGREIESFYQGES